MYSASVEMCVEKQIDQIVMSETKENKLVRGESLLWRSNIGLFEFMPACDNSGETPTTVGGHVICHASHDWAF